MTLNGGSRIVKTYFIALALTFSMIFNASSTAHCSIFSNAKKQITKKLKSVKKGTGVGKTTGGSSVVLANRLGIAARKGWAAHHVIPVQLKNHRALKKIGMDMDEIANGIALPTKPGLDPKLPLHRGSHPSYTAAIAQELDQIPVDASVSETKRMVSKIQKKYRQKLESGTPLHDKYGASDPWY
ncbi:hypothetical protein DSCW_01330 [Desulfosarcina widdelii]|uniref:LHH domain-containing protein n=1 Tax=Desulfosarcina widdelii TaxID=947919 RepID=A0A5K7YTP3_9BACT|nr:AHH domain-containing protein [Desulfosarcina widdelii]BBO72716.1 hypothetical protein DSCW_01330 [Desulfosarcina widdelii]